MEKKKSNEKKSKKIVKKKRAFTLIELLAVIIILGILMIIAIPSVTSYISDSRKESYIDTAKEIISGTRNLVNEGNLGMYNTDSTYYIPISCISTENAKKSPYGEFTEAYVGIVFDGSSYDYYWISNDTAGQGIKSITSQEKLDNDSIESNVKDEEIINIIETTGIKEKEKINILTNDCKTWNEELLAVNFADSTEKNAEFLTGAEVNIKMKTLAGDNPTDESSFDNNITAIRYTSNEPSDSNKESKNIVSTSTSNYPIYMWYDSGVIYWWSEDKTPSLNPNSSNFFKRFRGLSDISSISRFDTSNVTNFASFFKGDDSLTNVDAVKNWDVSNATTLNSFFSSCLNIEEIDLSNWETSDSLVDIRAIFAMYDPATGSITENKKLKRIKLSDKFNTSHVTDMSYLLTNNTKIEDYSFLEYLDTSSVTTLRTAFQYNESLTDTYYMRNWDTSNLTTLMWTFTGTYKLGCTSTSFDGIKNWNVSKVTNTDNTFALAGENCTSFYLDLSNWNTSKVETMANMFLGTGKNASTWNVIIPKTNGAGISNTTTRLYGKTSSVYVNSTNAASGKAFTLSP